MDEIGKGEGHVPSFLCFFAKFGIAIGVSSSQTKEPKLHKLGICFVQIIVKKHTILGKIGCFLYKMV